MKFYRLHSFFSLLLIAFAFACMPLLVALYSSVEVLDGLAQQSVATVYGSVERLKRSRELVGLLQDQERLARQYDVLGERSQLMGVNKAHSDFENTLIFFSAEGDEQLAELIGEMKAKENYINAVLNRFSSGPEILKREKQNVLSLYHDIGNLAAAMLRLSNQLMLDGVQKLRIEVGQDKDRLVWQTSGLIVFAVMICVVFILLIFKPVRQINKGIERLGEGNFQTPISVSGPRDLENLGTKLDWLRKRLAKLDKEKIKMIAHISHDLKTPLASIKEGAGLLNDELVGPINQQQKEVVQILVKNCGKLQRLIEDILNFNMAQAGKIPLQINSVPLQLDQLIEEVIADHRNSILARNIKLDVQLVSVDIYGNRNQLKSVFDNLISNALKFTSDQGIVRILLRTDSNIVACLVEDSGAGVDEEERSQIFSPFFRGKKAEKSMIEGSGLGLAISREYILNHGGTIRLLPSRKGARFAVTLPLNAQNKS